MIKFNKLTKKTVFILDQPDAQSVHLAGDFNGWNTESHPMKKDKKGQWKLELALEPGTYQFRYVINRSWWMNDPMSGEVPNEHGTTNSVVTVEAITKKTTRQSTPRKPRTTKTAKKTTAKRTKKK